MKSRHESDNQDGRWFRCVFVSGNNIFGLGKEQSMLEDAGRQRCIRKLAGCPIIALSLTLLVNVQNRAN